MEVNLLSAALTSRQALEAIDSSDSTKEFSAQGNKVLDVIREYYQSDLKCDSADKSIITDRLLRQFPSEKHKSVFSAIMGNLKENVSVPNILHQLQLLKKDNLKEAIRSCLEGGGTEKKLVELMDEFQQCNNNFSTNEITTITSDQAESLFDRVCPTALLKLSPTILNEVTDGGMFRGNHILIFARPDCGKTTLAVELIYGFLKQSLTVVYAGNEDPDSEIYSRVLSRLTRVPRNVLIKDVDTWKKAVAKAKTRNLNKFHLLSMEPGTIADIKNVVDKIKPDVLIIDQIRNLNTHLKNRVEELEYLEREVRNLGKANDMLTISFTQAGDSAQNKLILDLGDVDWSNTGMQACADLMIGMGVNNEYEASGRRMLSFPKNKRTPDKQPRQVTFDGKYSRIH